MKHEPIIGVLGLQGDVREHIAAVRRLGIEVVNVRSPFEFERVDALILPGGESTTLGMLLQSSELDAPIRRRLHEGMPAFGTCAGMILLSREVLDGRTDQRPFDAIDITVRRNAFGRQLDSFESDLSITGLEEPMHAVFIRAPVVVRHGPEVEVLAAVEHRGSVLPVVCRQRQIMVASFHPELTADARLHGLFLEMVRSAT